MKKIFKSGIVFTLLLLLIISVNVDFAKIFSLPSVFYSNKEEISQVNQNKMFGSVVNADFNTKTVNVSGVKETRNTVIFKLFGFIPIKKVSIVSLPEEEFFVGGNPIGISIVSDGLMVVQDNNIHENSNKKINNFKKGDFITSVNGVKISTIDEIKEVISNSTTNFVEIEFKRDNKEFKQIFNLKENEEGEFELGILVKDDISGVGTLTFVKKDNSFAALGHPISEENNHIPVLNGKIFDCNIMNIVKGEKNNPGQLRCVFIQKDGEKGQIENNNDAGVFGNLNDKCDLIDKNLQYKVGGRLSVKPGKAKIVSSVSGIREEYEIEIIKNYNQSKSTDKSIVFRVVDQRLLKITGGIVQGMSGSPIIQNNKLVGAVTHVFLNDPTKGYGIYADWML